MKKRKLCAIYYKSAGHISNLVFLNGYCYKYDFFLRIAHYIRRHVKNTIVIFFTDKREWDGTS